jgi:hypothetical protein
MEKELFTNINVILPKKVYTEQDILHHFMPTGNVCFKGWNNIDYFCMPLDQEHFDLIIKILKSRLKKKDEVTQKNKCNDLQKNDN